MTTQYFDTTSGASLAYQLFNTKMTRPTPLVLIQGRTGLKEDWRELLDAVAKDRSVLIFDNRGIGESRYPKDLIKKGFTIEDMAADSVELTKHIFPNRKVHVMGISMGGMIAQAYALQVPDIVDKLILGCTFHSFAGTGVVDKEFREWAVTAIPRMKTREEIRNFVEKNAGFGYPKWWVRMYPERFQELIDFVMKGKRNFHTGMAQTRAITKFNVKKEIETIRAPTLVIHGTDDRLVDISNGHDISLRIPEAVLYVVRGAGHIFWDVDDGESARVVRRFLINSYVSKQSAIRSLI